MRIAICDDENIWINHIEEYIKKIKSYIMKLNMMFLYQVNLYLVITIMKIYMI